MDFGKAGNKFTAFFKTLMVVSVEKGTSPTDWVWQPIKDGQVG
jgi:hypothetical protein